MLPTMYKDRFWLLTAAGWDGSYADAAKSIGGGLLLLVGGLPVFPHSKSWGYGPSGIIGAVLVVLLILLLLGKI